MPLKTILLTLRDQVKTGGSSSGLWDGVCLYAAPETCARDRYRMTDACWIGAAAIAGDDDVERLPPEAEGLGLYCYGRDLADIVDSAVSQRPEADAKDLLRALNYYSIHDAFLSFQEAERQAKAWSIGVFPGFSGKQLRKELDAGRSDLLSRGRMLEYPAGSVLIERGDSDLLPLCNLISFRSGWALYIYIRPPSSKEAGRWSHHLYHAGYPSSPRAHPDDPKKQNQFRLEPDLDGLCQAFPGTEEAALKDYFQGDALIRDAEEKWASFMTRRHRQKGWRPPEAPAVHRVRPEDRYASDQWRQVFDLLRYLSFPLEDELGIL